MLIAVDTNILLDQAIGDEKVLGALEIIKERLSAANFIISPTVIEELAFQAEESPIGEKRKAAGRVLDCMFDWGYQPLNVIPVGRGITEQISFKLRSRGIIPDSELNDSLVIAEAALIGCDLLLTSDAHLLEAQEHPAFRQILKSCDVAGDKIVVAHPRTVVSRFFRRR